MRQRSSQRRGRVEGARVAGAISYAISKLGRQGVRKALVRSERPLACVKQMQVAQRAIEADQGRVSIALVGGAAKELLRVLPVASRIRRRAEHAQRLAVEIGAVDRLPAMIERIADAVVAQSRHREVRRRPRHASQRQNLHVERFKLAHYGLIWIQ
jgi:hypothetical protein